MYEALVTKRLWPPNDLEEDDQTLPIYSNKEILRPASSRFRKDIDGARCADLIVVHGLGGDHEDTWKAVNGHNNISFWPLECLFGVAGEHVNVHTLPKKADIHLLPTVRVLTAGHRFKLEANQKETVDDYTN